MTGARRLYRRNVPLERRVSRLNKENGMNWKDDISDLARGWMELLGDFGPTVNEQKRELKGYLHDDEGGGKAYLDSGELREIAASCIEVANWLDDRADKTANY